MFFARTKDARKASACRKPPLEGGAPEGRRERTVAIARNISGSLPRAKDTPPPGRAEPSQRGPLQNFLFRQSSLPSQGGGREAGRRALRFAAAVGREGSDPSLRGKRYMAVMALAAGCPALETAPNGVPTRGAKEGGSRSRAIVPFSGTLSYKPYPKRPKTTLFVIVVKMHTQL